MSTSANFLGVDPGLGGAIALLKADGDAEVFDMPATEPGIARFFKETIAPMGINFCLLEQVHAFPEQGIVSTAKFMRNAGLLSGCLLMLGIPTQEIAPYRWQQVLGIPPRVKKPKKPKPMMQYPPEESHTEFKRRLLAKAQALFPGVKVTLRNADALLIAEVARRIRVGYQGRTVA